MVKVAKYQINPCSAMLPKNLPKNKIANILAGKLEKGKVEGEEWLWEEFITESRPLGRPAGARGRRREERRVEEGERDMKEARGLTSSFPSEVGGEVRG